MRGSHPATRYLLDRETPSTSLAIDARPLWNQTSRIAACPQ
jgi:hypothetical protein